MYNLKFDVSESKNISNQRCLEKQLQNEWDHWNKKIRQNI